MVCTTVAYCRICSLKILVLKISFSLLYSTVTATRLCSNLEADFVLSYILIIYNVFLYFPSKFTNLFNSILDTVLLI